MTIHEFGEENEGTIVLFHPLGVRWDVFNFVIPILREDYHLVIPAIPGFDPDAPEADFTSVEQVADEVAAWLVGHGFGHVTCLYGCSMGGAIVARMLAVGKAGADCAVMDGGMTPYRLWRPLTYLIGARDFAMMEIVLLLQQLPHAEARAARRLPGGVLVRLRREEGAEVGHRVRSRGVPLCADRRERRDGPRGVLHAAPGGVLREADRVDAPAGIG